MSDQKDQTEQGFFVEIKKGQYSKAFENLNSARSEARSIGSSLRIFHGVLKYTTDGINDSELFLVPKLKKST